MFLKSVNVLNIIKKFVNTALFNVLFMDYSQHSLGWYWELPVIPGLVISETHVMYIGYYWTPSQHKDNDFFVLWFLGNVSLIAGWSWLCAALYSLFILRDLSISGVMIRGMFLYLNSVYFYFFFLPEIVNLLTLNTSTDFAFFIIVDNWLVKLIAIYLWRDSISIAKYCILEAWFRHIRRDKTFGTMCVRNIRARNRVQREAIVYLIVIPLSYLGIYLSTINIGETWHVMSDQWIRWFVYYGNWRLPYYYPGNIPGNYQGRNHYELESFMSDYYPWWYIPGNHKGDTYFVNPYSQSINTETLQNYKKTAFSMKDYETAEQAAKRRMDEYKNQVLKERMESMRERKEFYESAKKYDKKKE